MDKTLAERVADRERLLAERNEQAVEREDDDFDDWRDADAHDAGVPRFGEI